MDPDDAVLSGVIGRLLHVDDPDRLVAYAALLHGGGAQSHSPREEHLALMLHFALWGANTSADESAASLSHCSPATMYQDRAVSPSPFRGSRRA